MKATKYTLKAEFNALSLDSFRSLILEMINEIDEESYQCEKIKSDGDGFSYSIESQEVIF